MAAHVGRVREGGGRFFSSTEQWWELVAWIAYGGEREPATHASSLRVASEAKNEARWPCPVGEYANVKNIKFVADWACGGDWQKADLMLYERPALFHRLLLIAQAENEAEPEMHKYADAKAKAKPRADAQANKPKNLAGTSLS